MINVIVAFVLGALLGGLSVFFVLENGYQKLGGK